MSGQSTTSSTGSADSMDTSPTIDPSQYNLRNPAVKRLLREAAEMAVPSDEISAQPLEDNLFEWHFTIRGAPESDFEAGIYHGRIILPPDYPMKPPSIILLTPNGRFETGTKICLSISSYHPETWRPSWSIRTALTALVSFMTTDSPGAIGSYSVAEYPADARKALAKKSLTWECESCGPIINTIKYSRPAKEGETSKFTSSAQRVFRLPSIPAPEDGVIPPEEITQNQNIPVQLPPADQMGDMNGNEEDDEDVFGDAFNPGNQTQSQLNDTVFGLCFGAIVLLIGGILFRRIILSGFD